MESSTSRRSRDEELTIERPIGRTIERSLGRDDLLGDLQLGQQEARIIASG